MDLGTIVIRIKQIVIIFMLLIVGAAIGAAGLYIIQNKPIMNIFEKPGDKTANDEQKNKEIIDDETGKLTEDSIKNAEYKPINYNGKKIKLVDGVYRKESLDGGSEDYVGIYNNKIAFADLNDDGKKEAAVILDSYSGGDAHLYELAIVINKNGKPFHVGSDSLGDRVVIKTLTVESNQIHINLVTHGEKDEVCCPSVNTVFQYAFSENQLKKVSQYELGVDETASWGLHRNEEQKFEIKYPDGFFFQEPEITISKIESKNSIDDCVPRKFEGFEVRKIQLNDINYCLVESSGVVAGLKYIDSSYTGIVNKNNLITLHFIVRYKNCETLGAAKSPQRVDCEYLNSDTPRVTQKVVSTFKLDEEPEVKK